MPEPIRVWGSYPRDAEANGKEDGWKHAFMRHRTLNSFCRGSGRFSVFCRIQDLQLQKAWVVGFSSSHGSHFTVNLGVLGNSLYFLLIIIQRNSKNYDFCHGSKFPNVKA